MPGPYVLKDVVAKSLSSRLGQAPAAMEPAFWTDLAEDGVAYGYQVILSALTRRGYSVTAIDRWIGRKIFNKKLATAHAMLQREGATDADKTGLFKEIELAEARLDDPEFILVADDGTILVPDLADGLLSSATGRLEAFDLAMITEERMNGVDPPVRGPHPVPTRDRN